MSRGACEPSSFPSQLLNNEDLARSEGVLYSDGDSETWEHDECNLILPIETEYLALLVAAHENIHNDPSLPEFDGHYADLVSLTIVEAEQVPNLNQLGTLLIILTLISLGVLKIKRIDA